MFDIEYADTMCGAGVAQWLCNGLPRKDPGFDSLCGRCKNFSIQI